MTITRKNIFFLIIIFFLILAAAPKAVIAVTIEIRVSRTDPACAQPACFTSIQGAINYVDSILNTGGTVTSNIYNVRVESGTYNEAITLKPNMPLIQGREAAKTVLIGPGSNSVFTVSGISNVTIANFTIRNAALGINVSNSSLTISNMIFNLGTAGTAISLNTSPSVNISNNVFFQNMTAISSSTDVPITNNIFSNNTTALQVMNNNPYTNVTYNSFFQNGNNKSDLSVVSVPSNTVIVNPQFVDPIQNDFHLLAISPLIGNGNPGTQYKNIFNPPGVTGSDMGAYGGPGVDLIPFVVSGLAASVPSPSTISLSWNPNNSYLTQGYRVHYGATSGGPYNGTGAAEGDSPFIVTGATSATLSSLPVATIVPATPVLSKPSPLNQSLQLNWTAVPNATKYTIYYSTSPFDSNTLPATFVEVDGGNTTSYSLTGLTNNITYYVAVSATAQNTYFLVVTAIDSSTGPFTPGNQDESTFSNEVSESVGPTFVSPISSPTLTAIPELLIPYPDLPSGTQGGCFIATAAYGDYSSAEVKVLREFRDKYLLTSGVGSAFVNWYYQHSPDAAAYLNSHPHLKPLVRTALTPAVVAALFMIRTSLSVKIFLIMFTGGALVFLIHRKRFSGTGGCH